MRGILAGTYAHSLSSLEDHDEFIREVKQLDRILLRLFGVKTKTFANTELIYDDDIAMLIAGMGFRNCPDSRCQARSRMEIAKLRVQSRHGI